MNSDTAAGAAWVAAHPHALTGVYMCCHMAFVDASGGVTARDLGALAGNITLARGSAFPPLTYHATFSVDEAGVHSGDVLKGVPALVEAAAAGKSRGVTGLLCDYEPADNYTLAHAKAYGSFLSALATALAAEGLELGFDVAGWGMLDIWAAYTPLPVTFVTSMTPTYDALNVGLAASSHPHPSCRSGSSCTS